MYRGCRERGFSLVEVIFAITILTIALVGLLSTILHINTLNATNRENLAAMRGAEQMIETMMKTKFEDIFAGYNEATADDPAPGPGTAPGRDFDAEGLVPQRGDADRKCGRISFPTNDAGTELREDAVDDELGMPQDLNANGAIDAGSVADNYDILPVTIEISWHGITGPRSMKYRHIFLKK